MPQKRNKPYSLYGALDDVFLNRYSRILCIHPNRQEENKKHPAKRRIRRISEMEVEKDLWENAPRAWERDDRSHAARLVATFGLGRHLDASALVPMNRNPSLSKVSDASSSKLYKMPSRSVTEPEKSGLQRGRGRDGREDLGMPKPNRPARKPVLRDLSDDSDDELEALESMMAYG